MTIKTRRMLDSINMAMNGTTDCRNYRLGECAMIDTLSPSLIDGQQIYVAALYLWDLSFNDSTAIAKWFADAGAEQITVTHTLYSEINGDRDGCCEDGGREMNVTFVMKEVTA